MIQDKNLTAWNKIFPILKKNNTNTAGFSVVNDCNNNEIIDSLIVKLGDEMVFYIINELGIENYDQLENKEAIIHSGDDFIICENEKAYLTNPFNNSILQQVYLTAKQVNVKITTIGFIIKTSRNLREQEEEEVKSIGIANVAQLVERMIEVSINRNATDVHIYPRNERYVFIKFRINGQLLESGINDISFHDYNLLANSLLDLSKKNPGVFSTFEEAKFDYTCRIGSMSVRLQMNPTIYNFDNGKICPSFVLRIHKTDKVSFRSIESLNFVPEHEQILKRVAKHNQGIILVSGPTNSGKTTALYGILAETMIHKEACVQTVEDPVEVELPGVKQLNINDAAGVDYTSALKSVLRSDVDVILVGEIRDPITAQKSVELDKTGHLVLSTLHTKTSLAIIDRLRQFGVSNADISDSLSVLMSSRLLPKVCQHCSTKQKVGDNPALMEKFSNKLKDLDTEIRVRNPEGCQHCDIGYSGRVMAAEVFVMDDSIKEMIADGAGQIKIYQHLKKNNNQTIWDHAFELLLSGQTTFQAMEQTLPTYIAVGEDFDPTKYTKM